MEIRQFRVVVRAADFDRTCRFYGEVLALPRVQNWDREDGRGALYQAGAGIVEVRGRAQIDRGSPLAPLHADVGVAVSAAGHPARQADHHSLAHGGRRRANQPYSPSWKIRHRPFSRVLTGARGNEVVRLSFETQETQDRREWSQANPPLPQSTRIQPGFVELQARGQEVRDTLMQARDEQTSHRGVAHTLRCGTGRGVPPGVKEVDRIGGAGAFGGR